MVNLTWVAYYLLLHFFLRANEQKEVALGSEFQNKKTKIYPLVSKAIFKPLYVLKEFYFGGGP